MSLNFNFAKYRCFVCHNSYFDIQDSSIKAANRICENCSAINNRNNRDSNIKQVITHKIIFNTKDHPMDNLQLIRLKYSTKCKECEAKLNQDEIHYWDYQSKEVFCKNCIEN